MIPIWTETPQTPPLTEQTPQTARATPLEGAVIALDADNVLLDYSLAYAAAWERAFQTRPVERDPQAYWPIDRWGVERLEGERLETFRACFDEEFWSTIPAVDGAVQACRDLASAGYTLVCVSAIHPAYEGARLRNLQSLGFPIARVIATGSSAEAGNPKASAINELAPAAFVDDYLPYLTGIRPEIHTALVHRQRNGSPNRGPQLVHAKSQHANLAHFAHWWLALPG